MPPPTGTWTGRGGRLLRGGCGGVPRSPGPPGEEGRRSLQEPVPHAGLPEPRPQPSDPGAPLHGHGISAEAGALPPPSCDPAPDRPRHKTVRSGHPGHRPGTPDDPENDPPLKPRTASRCRHDPTPPHDHFRPPPEKHQALQPPELSPVRVPAAVPRPHPTPHRSSRRVEPARQISTDHEIPHHIRRRMQIIKTQITTHRRTPRRTPGVGRQNHTNAATRTTPPSTSRNERNNTLDPTEPLPSGTIQEPHPEPPANRPRTSRVATGRPSLDHLQPGQEPDGSATTGQRMDRRDRKQIRVTLQEASTAPGPAARAVQGRCGRSARPPRHPSTGAQLPRGPRGSPRPRGRRQA